MHRFIARQPILDSAEALFGYELLFRESGTAKGFTAPANGDASATLIIDSSFTFDLQSLCGGRPAFINFSHDSLLHEYALLLPRERIIIEVLETVKPTAEIVAACEKLKKAGYRIALDDFEETPEWEPLVELADIVKVDFLATPDLKKRSLAARFGARGIQMLAEKVEQLADFQKAVKMGYSLFQGYFFAKPQIVSKKDISGVKQSYVRIFAALARPELDFAEVERMVKTEPSLCYKFLRYLNSPLLGFVGQIKSIRHALALIGERDFRRWFSAMAVMALGDGKPEELVLISVSRALFCEALAPLARHSGRGTDLYFLGLLSVMDALLGRTFSSILAEIRVSDEVRAALLGEKNGLRTILDCVKAYEQGNWETCSKLAESVHVNPEVLPGLYLRSMDWARQAFAA